jgi:hypothetical protein
MKKSNMLIAVFAVLAAASSAMAQVSMEFDGKLKPQSMHEIFANSHQLVPVAAPAPAEKKMDLLDHGCGLVCFDGQLTDNCTCEPYPWLNEETPMNWNTIYQYVQTGNSDYCLPVADGPMWMGCVVGAAPAALTAVSEIPGRAFMEMSASQKKALTVHYILQADFKSAIIARAAAYRFSPETVRFVSDAKTKILYDNGKVYISNGRILLVISDGKLLAGSNELRASTAHRSDARGIGGDLGVLIGCMANDNCWGAVGDAVSDVSEAITHNYYTNGPGAGHQQGWDDMPD